jgi:putative ABC transport system substrate-binding protein
MKRRAFIAALGATVAWPRVAWSDDKRPVVGYLSLFSSGDDVKSLAAFLKGLGESGFVEGRNVVIEYRWAEGRAQQMDELAADLVRRQVAVIATPEAGTPGARAAKKATSTTPIVFVVGGDPVALGLVPSLSRPDGNLTGITTTASSLTAKRIQFARELAPTATRIVTLINPTGPVSIQFGEALQRAAADFPGPVLALSARSPTEIDTAFARLDDAVSSVFISSPDNQFASWRTPIIALAARHRLPCVFEVPSYVREGGLSSYGTDAYESFRQSGVYVGRILNGEKPADLPVKQTDKFIVAVNLRTAAALGLEIPPMILAAADEVIE